PIVPRKKATPTNSKGAAENNALRSETGKLSQCTLLARYGPSAIKLPPTKLLNKNAKSLLLLNHDPGIPNERVTLNIASPARTSWSVEMLRRFCTYHLVFDPCQRLPPLKLVDSYLIWYHK